MSSNHNTSFLDHLGEPRTRMSNRSQFCCRGRYWRQRADERLDNPPQEPMSETGMEDTQDDRINSIQITTKNSNTHSCHLTDRVRALEEKYKVTEMKNLCTCYTSPDYDVQDCRKNSGGKLWENLCHCTCNHLFARM